MIIPSYKIETATFKEAGKGMFLMEAVKRGSVLCAPDKIERVYQLEDKAAFNPDEEAASVRWFERYYTVSHDWPDECFINHSFTPTGLWHLGFIFARDDYPIGTELTVDYRLIVDDGEILPFKDLATGKEIVGLNWRDNILHGAKLLQELLS